MKTLDDALALRTKIFGAFEMAELADDPAERQAWLTFAVVGGGPTGVEIAGQIKELAKRSLGREFRQVRSRVGAGHAVRGWRRDPRHLRGSAVGQGDQGAREGRRRDPCQEPGHDVTEDAIKVQADDGETSYSCRTKVWAAGVTAPAAGPRSSPMPRARRRSSRPDRGSARLHAAWSSRGLRRRRRDVARQAARRGRGRYADRASLPHETIKHRVERRHRGASRSSTAISAAWRRGPVPGDRRLQGDPGRRIHRLDHVGLRPPDVPHRLQEPVLRRFRLGAELPRARPGPSDRSAGPSAKQELSPNQGEASTTRIEVDQEYGAP